ncbi:hypothetical protein [Hyalangium versicolor]|uniref:hypothetical protein n=1 Tax=Hyalangium versicolor TaxID=2861190 RepID=UPI001CCCD73D|nr:hypothetical protein [Hyalangium versicolor]
MSPRVYDWAVTAPAPQEPLSNEEAPPSRGRASTIGAVAFVLLAAPFLVFSLMMFNLKARVELQCAPLGPCKLVHISWLGREQVDSFTVPEIQGVTIEHNRSSKSDDATLYKPVLKTTRGDFPLSTHWLNEEADAQRTAQTVNRFRANPLITRGRSFMLFHDHRRGPLIVGSSFGAVGVILLGFSAWLAFKARRHFRAERVARAAPPTA